VIFVAEKRRGILLETKQQHSKMTGIFSLFQPAEANFW